jgi:hypothetical protein
MPNGVLETASCPPLLTHLPACSSQPHHSGHKSRQPQSSAIQTAREKNKEAQQRFRMKQKKTINQLKDEVDSLHQQVRS